MSCIIASNQPIYEALLEKAKSYPEDKVYQKKAYENVAKNLLTFERNLHSLYTSNVIVCLKLFPVPGAGYSITKFIKEFIETSKATTSSTLTYSTQAMDEARRLAAQNAPKVEASRQEPEQKPEPEQKQKYTQNAMKDVNSVTLSGPPLTTSITYITIETTQSLDDIMKCIKAMNESVTSNPPK